MPAKTIRGLARKCGVSDAAVRKWLKRPDWPLARKPPWSDAQIEKIADWRQTLQDNRASPSADQVSLDDGVEMSHLQAKALYERERALEKQLKREMLARTLIHRDTLDGALGGVARLFVDALQELELTLPERLAGKTAGQIANDLARIFDATRKRIVERGEFDLMRITDLAKGNGKS